MPDNQNSPISQCYTTRTPHSPKVRQPELLSLPMPDNQKSSVSQCHTTRTPQSPSAIHSRTPQTPNVWQTRLPQPTEILSHTANRKCITVTQPTKSVMTHTKFLMTLTQPTEILMTVTQPTEYLSTITAIRNSVHHLEVHTDKRCIFRLPLMAITASGF